MLTQSFTRAVVSTLVFAASVSAQAACRVQTSKPASLSYVANKDLRGTFAFDVVCDKPTDHYNLAISAPGGTFDPASGSYLFTAIGKAGSRLNLRLENASSLFGGPFVTQTYQGSQSFSYPMYIPTGQWTAAGMPSFSLSIALSDAAN